MRTFLTTLLLSVLFTIFLTPCIATTKEPGMAPMFLHNKATGELKTRCLEVMGRYDYRPHFECFTQAGKLERFDPGTDWEPVPLTSACFRHQVRDTIKNCAAYQLKNKKEPGYVCHDEQAGKYVSFDLGTEWIPLKSDDPACREREFGPDVIRDFEFEIDADALEQKSEPAETVSPETVPDKGRCQ